MQIPRRLNHPHVAQPVPRKHQSRIAFRSLRNAGQRTVVSRLNSAQIRSRLTLRKHLDQRIRRQRHYRNGDLTSWGIVRDPQKQIYRRNSYRVLLTRARQGIVIYIPRGDSEDTTRSPLELDRTADYLTRCGVIALPEKP